jgi:hypothetical protein
MYGSHPLGDWSQLVHRLDAAGIPGQWSGDPRLAGLRSIDELRVWTAPGNPGRADEVLAALVHLAAGEGADDHDAVIVLLHLLLPGARRIAERVRHLAADPLGLVLGELALQVHSYPLSRRTHAYAANLLMTTQQVVWRELKRYRTDQSVPPELLIDPIADTHGPDGSDDGRLGVLDREVRGSDAEDIDLVDMLLWARRTGAVDAEDLAVLVEVEYARETPGIAAPLTVVAARRGCTVRTVQRRRDRALRRLRAHRDTYLAA